MMRMVASYVCSLNIWNMKFCSIWGCHSFIWQVITSRIWSSSLFLTLFQPLKCTKGTTVVCYCAVKSDRFLWCSYSNCDVSRQLSALYCTHTFENFGFWCFLNKKRPSNKTHTTKKKNPQDKKPNKNLTSNQAAKKPKQTILADKIWYFPCLDCSAWKEKTAERLIFFRSLIMNWTNTTAVVSHRLLQVRTGAAALISYTESLDGFLWVSGCRFRFKAGVFSLFLGFLRSAVYIYWWNPMVAWILKIFSSWNLKKRQFLNGFIKFLCSFP